MPLLTEREKQLASADVEELITGDNTQCEVRRPVRSGEGSFHGGHEESETTVIQSLPVEVLYGAPEGLVQEGADAVANISAGADVQEGDFLVIGEVRYRVTDVNQHSLFGADTHKTLTLEREYRDEG